MNQLATIKDKFSDFWAGQIESINKKIFGVNNERLDFFMDSFSKYTSQQKAMAAGGAAALLVVGVIGIFGVYFAQVHKLQKELSDNFAALHKLRSLKAQEVMESKHFDSLSEMIKRKIAGLNMKPFFEKISKDTQIVMSNLKEEKLDLEPKNPLSKAMKQSRVTMRLSKISIPKILQFLMAVENADKFLRISDLKISGMYGNKLYFDVTVTFLGYTGI